MLLILESRLKDLYENNEQELIWTLEHNEVFTAGTSYKENEIIDKSIKILKQIEVVKLLTMGQVN